MAKIKDNARISSKWKRRSETAGPEYEDGVRNPRTDWAQATSSAETSYEQGTQAAIARKAFGKGVRKAGTGKWQENALAKGPTRYANGVQLAQSAYEEGFAPFRQVISGVNLPPRGPKGDPKNIARVTIIAKALHDKKIELEGR